MNNKGVIRYYNGTDALYTLFNNGILEIKNVTVADNDTEYRSEVGSTRNLDPEHILLLYYENEGKKVFNNFFFWLSIYLDLSFIALDDKHYCIRQYIIIRFSDQQVKAKC